MLISRFSPLCAILDLFHCSTTSACRHPLGSLPLFVPPPSFPAFNFRHSSIRHPDLPLFCAYLPLFCTSLASFVRQVHHFDVSAEWDERSGAEDVTCG